MKILITHISSELDENQKRVIDDFLKFHQKQTPINNDIKIVFLGDRVGKMTTGSRSDKDTIKILSKDRMLIDILRTLSHELIHQYQHENMNLDFTKDIGGPAEDMANSESGKILKIFQKEFPQHMGIIYQ